jgi:hypothetical protein
VPSSGDGGIGSMLETCWGARVGMMVRLQLLSAMILPQSYFAYPIPLALDMPRVKPFSANMYVFTWRQ